MKLTSAFAGESKESSSCNEDPCVKNPEWTEWEEWSSCSKSCGGGTTQRSRTCLILESRTDDPEKPEKPEDEDGKPCPGPSTVMLFCNLQDCPVTEQWSPWGPWSECSKNCGGGSRSRSRTCDRLNVLTRDADEQSNSCTGTY